MRPHIRASAIEPPAAGATDRGVPRRTLLGSVAALTSAGLLAACSSSSVDPATKAKGASAEPVTFTDQRGKQIRLAHPARRVVTIPMPAASILVAVDQGIDHLVGMQNASWVAMRDGYLGEAFPQALTIPHGVADNNFVPNVESVLALEPDLVIQWGDMGTAVIAPLENAGLTVAGLTYGTQADVDTWITLFAAALGRPERATLLNAGITTSLARMAAAGKAATRPGPSILYFNRFSGGLKVAGTGSYNDFYITLIGGQNPASGPHGAPGKGMVGVDVEQVLAWDPDIVLLGNFDAAKPSDLYTSSVWRGLSAVANHRVYKVPLGGYRWDPPSHESPLMWRWLSMVAFPGQKAHDLRADVVSSYRRFYGQAPTSAQLDAILWTTVNGASADYHQFHA